MANEFIIRNGFISRADSELTGSLHITEYVSASAYIKSGSTSDDILLGDGTTTSLSGLGAGSAPPGTVSSSIQIDHDQTTNYTASQHIDWTINQDGTSSIDLGNFSSILEWTGSTGQLSIIPGNSILLGFEFVDTGTGFTFGTPDDKIIVTGDLEFEAAATGSYEYSFPEQSGIVQLANWQIITGSAHTAVDSGKYIADSATRVVFTIPTTNNRETVHVTGKGVGGWQIDVPSGWTFTFADEVITDNIQSTQYTDSVQLICTGNDAFHVVSSVGNITFNNL